jgi:mannan endo-1,4-beta-mannosidase
MIQLTQAAVLPNNSNRIRLEDDALVITRADGEAKTLPLRKDFSLVDDRADGSARRLYQYMEAMGRSGCVMYGHQNDLWDKAGARELSFSDTKDAVGEYPGVVGMDALALVGNEFDAELYNARYAGRDGVAPEPVDIASLGTAYADVVAAAKLINHVMGTGAVVTMSAHMPNFTKTAAIESSFGSADAQERKKRILAGGGRPQAYARYDFFDYTPNVVEGNVVTEIMPGGSANEVYRAYLDMIADFAKLLDGAIMFRPFHENTGSWFWWGEDHCTPEQFRELYRYTVRYLRDEKDVHNLLYVYSPGSEPRSPEEFEIRYPGDDYVDMVGFDMYDRLTEHGESGRFFRDFKKQIGILGDVARRHDKLMAVTETGLSVLKPDEGHEATALHDSGNKNRRWYMDVLDAVAGTGASYFLLWANFSKRNSYYTPYVDEIDAEGRPSGHELLDEYIRYYNDPRSVFSGMQREAVCTFQARKDT